MGESTEARQRLGKKLGQRISERRKSLNWTQDQLAERLGVDAETVSRFERGATVPSLVTLDRRAIAPSCHNPKQLGAKFVDRRSQHALGLDARLARRVEPQQVHHDVANDGEIVGSVAGAYP